MRLRAWDEDTIPNGGNNGTAMELVARDNGAELGCTKQRRVL